MKLINIGFGNMVNANRLVADRQPGICAHQADYSGLQGARHTH